uniref:Uncharacterized protein n=1 Tax=Chromera velia CCMP2878 TaxID=1169474 RepID=A0A0G4HQR1_9ALVE|eukprot:Cvel_8018.t1-p1 / transcript=Cvel_8018.t1 / gene=Cvel_8018 / organism=Chromera_velia_CCMP2878 / gene_product=hypothetical protein / transcript_product=hypothetical protein / location=Cvel_scaffold433:47206-48351(-) / protein_length=176 / sequence_SO=supercontig / SO=protein_coding / is_pseudo=false
MDPMVLSHLRKKQAGKSSLISADSSIRCVEEARLLADLRSVGTSDLRIREAREAAAVFSQARDARRALQVPGCNRRFRLAEAGAEERQEEECAKGDESDLYELDVESESEEEKTAEMETSKGGGKRGRRPLKRELSKEEKKKMKAEAKKQKQEARDIKGAGKGKKPGKRRDSGSSQ